MSLRAEIEAVIYAAEEPVTLGQLAAVFAKDPRISNDNVGKRKSEGGESRVETLIERGFLEAAHFSSPDLDLTGVAMLIGREERKAQKLDVDATAEEEAKRAARQQEREVQKRLKQIVDGLIEEYARSDRGMEIREVAGGYRIATKPEYHDAVRAFVKSLKPAMKLSLQALETLAVIAYKQPITAPEVGEIRGVDSGGVLGGLISRKLITTAGRKQVIGRPILYKTTREFLLRFGLKDLGELPSIEEFEKLAGDIEIAEDETTAGATGEISLPFEDGEMDEDHIDIAAVDANAGEPGVAIEAAQIPAAEAASTPLVEPEIIPLSAEMPEAGPIDDIEVTPASHPTVPIEDDDRPK